MAEEDTGGATARLQPATDHDWTVHSLNIHGTFFERWCEHAISKVPYWRVRATQYPVSFAPLSGAMLAAGGRESTLDIRAECGYHDGRLINLLIECKKNNPEFVEWHFFPVRGHPADHPFTYQAVECPTAGQDREQHIFRPQFRERDLGIPVTDDARETRGDYQSLKNDAKKTKTANDSISNAAHQIALAMQSVFTEEASRDAPRPPLKGFVRRLFEKQVFFPCIVTTARLKVCEFDPADVSPVTGEIAYNRVKISEHPYLIYKYPLPRHLQMDRGHLLYLSSEDYDQALTRMDILIVNSAHMIEFLEVIKSRFGDYFLHFERGE